MISETEDNKRRTNRTTPPNLPRSQRLQPPLNLRGGEVANAHPLRLAVQVVGGDHRRPVVARLDVQGDARILPREVQQAVLHVVADAPRGLAVLAELDRQPLQLTDVSDGGLEQKEEIVVIVVSFHFEI